jgi:hypothetical protein
MQPLQWDTAMSIRGQQTVDMCLMCQLQKTRDYEVKDNDLFHEMDSWHKHRALEKVYIEDSGRNQNEFLISTIS